MAKDQFQPIRAADLQDHAHEKNEQGEYLFPDLGPATTVEQLLFRPERPYLVDGVLTQGSLALLSAESFVGKTFFGMELARAVSTGSPFMGKYPTSRGGVLYIAQDGSDEEYLRQWKKLVRSRWDEYRKWAGWQTWRAVLAGEYAPSGKHPDPPPLHPFNGRIRFEFNRALGIDVSEDVRKIGLTALRTEHSKGEVNGEGEFGASTTAVDPDATEKGVKLIVFDAGHSVFFGNENDSGEVQNVMTNLRQLAGATGATVVLMAHLNKFSSGDGMRGIQKVHENRVRGSGVFQSAPDWHMQLHRGQDKDEVYAFQLKDRAGNRCRSFVYSMTFDDRNQQMTLQHVRDMTQDEHSARRVKPALGLVGPDPKPAVKAEFDGGREMSRTDVAEVLRRLPQYQGLKDGTLQDKAKKIIGALERDGTITQTQKPARGREARYRKTDAGRVAG
jgi:hypothetical protein